MHKSTPTEIIDFLQLLLLAQLLSSLFCSLFLVVILQFQFYEAALCFNNTIQKKFPQKSVSTLLIFFEESAFKFNNSNTLFEFSLRAAQCNFFIFLLSISSHRPPYLNDIICASFLLMILINILLIWFPSRRHKVYIAATNKF